MTYIPRRYKLYRALLTQSSTSAPTAVVLENSTNETLTFGYTSTGFYSINATGLFPVASKVFILVRDVNAGGGRSYYSVTDANSIQIVSLNSSLSPTNGILNSTPVEILIYP